MPDEASIPPNSTSLPQAADTQAPPSEPVTPPTAESTPPPEAAPDTEPVPESEPHTPTTTSVETDTLPQAGGEERREIHGDIAKARTAIQNRKQKKLEKIMAKLSEKNKITNDEVEKLLHVSDATATRYLQSLEKENKIKQTGKTGMAVFYEKV